MPASSKRAKKAKPRRTKAKAKETKSEAAKKKKKIKKAKTPKPRAKAKPKTKSDAKKKKKKKKNEPASARRVGGKHDIPCVLAIGGLDPGGGAGVLADGRAITRTGAFACAAVSILTIQSTSGLRSATVVAAKDLLAACTEVMRSQNVRAIKIGALGNEENAKCIGDLLAIHRELPSVVDTVMLPSRGSGRLLEESALATFRDRVLRRATLVTANAPEAEVLTGQRVTRLDEARDAAIVLLGLGPRAVLLKGGHLSGAEAIDLLALREDMSMRIVEIRSPRLRLPPVHGGGCALASLIAGRIALGDSLLDAVRWAKKMHHAALKEPADVGGDMRVLFT